MRPDNAITNCRGCGSVLDANEKCPVCGYRVEVSYWKSPQFVLLVIGAHLVAGIVIANYRSHKTEKRDAATEALQRLQSNPVVASLMGVPISLQGKVAGEVKEDETGWQEARLTLSVQGTKTSGTAKVVAGRTAKSEWRFSTLDVIIPAGRKRVDVVTGKVADYDPAAYIPIHNKPAEIAEYTNVNLLPPAWDGRFPCVKTEISSKALNPVMASCSMPLPSLHDRPLDQFYVDLRTGALVLQQTDLFVEDGISVPLTRTYSSMDWTHANHEHAFGRQANHPFDIALLGTRNPYTYLILDLPNGDYIYFERISTGTGYNDAVYQHRETSSRYFKAIIRWNGDGWETKLQDGFLILFPESYSAKNMAQGAPTEMQDAAGKVLRLKRDSRRNLQEIETPNGHYIRFTFDDHDRIVRAEDDHGGWAQYQYNQDGYLVDVVHSDGNERHYTYSAHFLTWIRDEKGRVLVHNYYEDYKIVRQELGEYGVYLYHYSMGPNNRYSERTTVVLPNGSLQTVVTGNLVPKLLKESRPLD